MSEKNLSYSKTLQVIIPICCIVFSLSCTWDCYDETDPACSNYDRCLTVKPAKAEIGIYEHIAIGKNFFNQQRTDTILQRNGAVFKSEGNSLKNTWILGGETLETSEFYRSGFPEGLITVTLISEVAEDTCLSTNEQIDTVTKQFYVQRSTSDSIDRRNIPWWGTWQGYNTDMPEDEFTITWGYVNQYKDFYLEFTGLPKGMPVQRPFYLYTTPVASEIHLEFGFNSLIMEANGHNTMGAFDLKAICIRRGKSVSIDYEYEKVSYDRFLSGEDVIDNQPIQPVMVSKSFKGRKINDKVLTR